MAKTRSAKREAVSIVGDLRRGLKGDAPTFEESHLAPLEKMAGEVLLDAGIDPSDRRNWPLDDTPKGYAGRILRWARWIRAANRRGDGDMERRLVFELGVLAHEADWIPRIKEKYHAGAAKLREAKEERREAELEELRRIIRENPTRNPIQISKIRARELEEESRALREDLDNFSGEQLSQQKREIQAVEKLRERYRRKPRRLMEDIREALEKVGSF